eukprot:6202953-Pleurochrysis_carterae.AAC.3
MPPVDMFGASVMFWFACQVDGGHVVQGQSPGLQGVDPQFPEERAKVDGLFGRLGRRDNLGLAREY